MAYAATAQEVNVEVLRIHFGAADLARTRVATIGPVAETVFGLRALRPAMNSNGFALWRRRAVEMLTPRIRSLGQLYPATGHALDLVSLVGDVTTIEEVVAKIPEIADHHLRKEIEPIVNGRPAMWIRELAGGSPTARANLATAVAEFYDVAIAPYWPRVRAALESERFSRARSFLDGGVDLCIATLGEFARWRPPVLMIFRDRLPSPARELGPESKAVSKLITYDYHLDGRGLVLLPSVFTERPELVVSNDDGGVMLIYPALRSTAEIVKVFASPNMPNPLLAPMLGRARAAVLEAVASKPEITSGELAGQVGISLASASEHVAVLRRGGLISSRRDRNRVHHVLTAAGQSLVDSIGVL